MHPHDRDMVAQNALYIRDDSHGVEHRHWFFVHADENQPAVEARADAIGAAVAKMHDAGIVHRDLTTSNMMIRRHPRGAAAGGAGKRPRAAESGDAAARAASATTAPLCVTLIDFGLGAQSATNPEDRAVDLYVLERAMASTHPGSDVRLVPRVL